VTAWSPQDEPIIVGKSLAGVVLGTPAFSVSARLGRPASVRRGRIPAEQLEIWTYDGFSVFLTQGHVYMLSAEEGYRGKAVGGVSVGTTWRDLIRAIPNLEFDEDRRTWHDPALRGIAFVIVRPTGRSDSATELEEHDVASPDTAYVESIDIHEPSRG
jgi:hypothetical protein